MNKKFLSAILFGALTVASTGSFVSCKDYDDDIDNLQTQINGLASAKDLSDKVSALQSQISSAQSAAEAKAAAAQAVAEAAKAAAEKAGASAADVAKALEAAVKDLEAKGATKEAVEAAQAAADAAKAAAEKAAADADAAIKAVEEKLDAAVKAAEEKAVAAQAAADAAKAAVEALDAKAATKAEVEAVKAAAEAAQAAADKAQAAADEAAKVAEENKAALEALTAKSATKDEVAVVAAKVAANAEAIATKAEAATVEALTGRVEALEAAVEALAGGEEAYKALVAMASTLEKNLEALKAEVKAMITEVSLIESFTEYGGQGRPLSYSPANPINLGFKSVVEYTTVFGKGLPGEITFTEGAAHSLQESNVVVRVNPANATFAAEDVKLIDSKGNSLDDVIEVVKVEKYDHLITRAASNTGLWTITVKVKDNISKEALEKATTTKVNNDVKKICYAVAIGNAERSVVSTYDITAAPNEYTPEDKLDLFASDKDSKFYPIAKIHNRFTESETGESTLKAEYTWWKKWNVTDKKSEVPAIAEKIVKKDDEAKKLWQNVTNRADDSQEADDRQGENLLAVEVNKAIDLHVMWDTDNKKVSHEIKGFYVAYDTINAVESAPSEWNAWTSYEVENLNVVQPGNTGSITIKSESANGDVIGFRIYAVNLDGTLLDPDGRAFYVYVGNATKIGTVPTQPILATSQNKSKTTTDFLADFQAALAGIKNANYHATDWTPKHVEYKVNGVDLNTKTAGQTTFQVWVKENGSDKLVTKNNICGIDLSKVTDVWYVMPNAQNFIDGETYEQSMKIYKTVGSTDVLVKTITVSFTKVMPSEAPVVKYITGQTSELLLAPIANPTSLAEFGGTTATQAAINLNNVYYELSRQTPENAIAFTVDNSVWNTEKKAYADALSGNTAENATDLVIVNDNAKAFTAITNGSAHTIKFAGYYENVSYALNADKTALVPDNFTTTKTTDFPVTYNCWDKFTTWSWNKDYKVGGKAFKPELQWTTAGNPIEWGQACVIASNSKNPEIFNNTIGAYALWTVIKAQDIYLEDVKNPEQKNNYFTPEFLEEDGFKFTKTQNSSNPAEDVKQVLKMKVTDVFGHEIVLELGEVTILRQK